jgi:hypothetical protein
MHEQRLIQRAASGRPMDATPGNNLLQTVLIVAR